MSGALSEEERALLSAELGLRMLDLIEACMAGRGNERDLANVGVSAAIGTAVALALSRGLDAAAAIALVTCLAESVGKDMAEKAA